VLCSKETGIVRWDDLILLDKRENRDKDVVCVDGVKIQSVIRLLTEELRKVYSNLKRLSDLIFSPLHLAFQALPLHLPDLWPVPVAIPLLLLLLFLSFSSSSF